MTASVRSRLDEAGRAGGGRNEAGSALLLMTATLLMIMAGLFLDVLGSSRAPGPERQATARALGRAQEALLARAGAAARTGTLPCPDLDLSGDGLSDAPCRMTGEGLVGWLPWRELGLPPLRDGSGALLWYAVAAGRVASVDGAAPGVLRIRGGTADVEAAAVLIAPGPVLAGQRRARGVEATLVRNGSLEGENGWREQDAGDRLFEAGPVSATFNDRLLAIPARALPGAPRVGG